MLFDLQVPTDAAYGKHNIMSGTRNDLVVTNLGSYALDVSGNITQQVINDTILNSTLSAVQVNSGEVLGTNIADTATTAKQTYCLNLLSVVGSLCANQYFPLFSCTSSPLRVEIQLVSSLSNAMICTSPNAEIKLSNIEFVANFIELSDVAMSMISQSLAGAPLQFVIPQFKNFTWAGLSALPDSQTQISIPVPAKYSSLKSLFIIPRDVGSGIANAFPFSSVSKGIQEYTFRIGPNVFPSKAPSTLTEMFCEVCKAIGSIADINHQPSIEKKSYTLHTTLNGNTTTDPQYNNVQSGSFYIGLDLENYSSASKESIFAGYNSNTDDIYCNITYARYNAAGSNNTMRWDCFASFDCVYVFENNTCYIRF
jgi:hypothetical protein